MSNKTANPYEGINFVPRRAIIFNKDGEIIFEKSVIFPDYFSDNAVNIVSDKYLSKSESNNETDLRQLFDRVSNEISKCGFSLGYFKNEQERDDFNYKLKYYQARQYFSFNSPVYFNVGINDKFQASACFILDVQDDMESIANVGVVESKIFKKGSGSGMNLSPLRSKFEPVGHYAGFASGPVSFLKVHDTFAGVVRSGGSLRRSAKMACLNIDHPDIDEFIECKKYEEEKLKALKKSGIEPRPGYELSDEVYFQNTNLSVRVKNDFMRAVLDNKTYSTKFVTTGKIHETFKARDKLYKIAERSWDCGDPCLLFHDNTNDWNTCANDGEINSCNPCAEFVFLDNSACNLAAINLLKFFSIDENYSYSFDFETFNDIVKTVITAQDILVSSSTYPTEKITENSISYRPLGLGYTNLGATLMYLGLPYDSNRGREIASFLTSLLTGCAYKTSNEIANNLGAFSRFQDNKSSFYKVLNKHIECNETLCKNTNNHLTSTMFKTFAKNVWDEIKDIIKNDGEFRNAQVTLLAPCGTTSFLMDAQTTGIEPEFSHVKYKRLSNTDSGVIKITSNIVHDTLKNLKYTDDEIISIENYIKSHNTVYNCPDIDEKDYKIFDTSCGNNTIDYMAHVKMMAAVQPFLSGSISKTVNMPNNCTIEDVFKIYLEAWSMGLKGITIYRDGSKSEQPLSVSDDDDEDEDDDDITDIDLNNRDKLVKAIHSILAERKLPEERAAINHKFSINSLKGYLNCGLYENGDLGEIFITISKEGSTLSGLLDCLATLTSISLQRGVPLKDIVDKMMYQKFEPAGFTSNKNIKVAFSVVDYIYRYLGLKFLNENDQKELGLIKSDNNNLENTEEEKPLLKESNLKRIISNNFAGPMCSRCGAIMIKKGACNTCMNCGSNDGACG